jgi:glutaredoxin-related protein
MIDIDNIIKNNTIVIFSKPNCKYCTKSYDLLNNNNMLFYKFNVGDYIDSLEFDEIYDKLQLITNKAKSYPMIFIEKEFVGGFNELQIYVKNYELSKAIEDTDF